MNETVYVYIVHSDIDENNVYAEFRTEEEALEYAKAHEDDLTYVDKVEVALDEDGEIIEMFDSETIWVYDEEDDDEDYDYDEDEEDLSWSVCIVDLDSFDSNWVNFDSEEEATNYYNEYCDKTNVEVQLHDPETMVDSRVITEGFNLEALVEKMEENEDMVECKECFELFPKTTGTKHEHGYVCPHCAEHVHTVDAEPDFEVTDFEVFALDFPEVERITGTDYPEVAPDCVGPECEVAAPTPETEVEPAAAEAPVEAPVTKEETINTLVRDEQEAIEGYEKAKIEIESNSEMTEEEKEAVLEVIEHIKEEELEHIEELTELVVDTKEDDKTEDEAKPEVEETEEQPIENEAAEDEPVILTEDATRCPSLYTHSKYGPYKITYFDGGFDAAARMQSIPYGDNKRLKVVKTTEDGTSTIELMTMKEFVDILNAEGITFATRKVKTASTRTESLNEDLKEDIKAYGDELEAYIAKYDYVNIVAGLLPIDYGWDTDGLSGYEDLAVDVYKDGNTYCVLEYLENESGPIDGDPEVTAEFETMDDLVRYLLDSNYITEAEVSKTKVTEETHAQFAKPEGNRVQAFNNALKYAKQYNKPFIYGYSNHTGKFFALDQPIKMTKEPAECEKDFRHQYKNCSVVAVAYPDKSFLKEETVELDEYWWNDHDPMNWSDFDPLVYNVTYKGKLVGYVQFGYMGYDTYPEDEEIEKLVVSLLDDIDTIPEDYSMDDVAYDLGDFNKVDEDLPILEEQLQENLVEADKAARLANAEKTLARLNRKSDKYVILPEYLLDNEAFRKVFYTPAIKFKSPLIDTQFGIYIVERDLVNDIITKVNNLNKTDLKLI